MTLARILRAQLLVWLAGRDLTRARRLDALAEAYRDRADARLALARSIVAAERAALGLKA